jgi:branched-subunit amino acid transport protein
MIKELNLLGIYIHPFMIALLLAFISIRPTNNLLNRIGFYRHVWHPGMFDTALFFILYALFIALLVPDVIMAIFHMTP